MRNLCLFHFLSHLTHLFLHLYGVLFLVCVCGYGWSHLSDGMEYPVERRAFRSIQ